ncbi:hypothetical protein Asppvi_002126 [Aspergillus pseudoviridinutans]|uniref:Uncharacterized protein n=1 Tax=Aspergillus pseudoviridinutans TaxID=1517512 RepID=A0A9P3B2J3_9EURO|nr:uncharacterized protein Asppvi_002126 [Aspergillus pseudoviridinutans]GIJ83307.1 hypothetical protein Asppvi_002126 [Aspergillus pseudoviridinutans]
MTAESTNDDPQFAFNFADTPDDTKKDERPKAKKVECTKKEVQAILNLQGKEEWLEWLRSDMRGKGISEIQSRTVNGEAHRMQKYSTGWLVEIHAPLHIEKLHGGMAVMGTKQQGEGVTLGKGKAKSSDGPSKTKKARDDGDTMRSRAQPGDDRQSANSTTMIHGNTGSQDKDVESEDEVQLSEDEEEDDIPSLAVSPWKAGKKPDVFDPTETYWKFRRIVGALKYVELAPEVATADAITLTDHETDPTTQENTEFDPPSTSPGGENGARPASTFDSSKYVNVLAYESELTVQIDARIMDLG